ncbi:hypothetical protein F1847_02250 [Thermodesulfobacterium sp. TA1]|uniref:tetratricopeptide repeat protein n=1 Tax=Thermodesulfobacterium sp. TA1 TaxID=2234087 RepID=UPI00123228DD|nr:hypothetical protein [Thermodesulfobacterium sp. TA1]QER41621.1 hypothetical protein F1847_02250 [Thermodesulfobacterium sp. TA1]
MSKGLKFVCLFLGLFLAYFIPKVFSQPKNLQNATLISSNFTLTYQQKGEEILQEIKNAYARKEYEKVVFLAKSLPALFSVRPEENLLIAESALKEGFLSEAIDFAQKVASVTKGRNEACVANLIRFKSLFLMGKGPLVVKEVKEFLDSYCDDAIKKEAKILLYHFKVLPEKEIKDLSATEIKKNIREFYKTQIVYLLRQGKVDEARSKVFYYINVYGAPEEAPELLLKLAEAYFKKGEREKAKNLYQLIITFWDKGNPSLVSKFRLYQIAYEKAPFKELLPRQTKEDLLSFSAQVKAKFSKTPLAEEAHLVELRVLSDLKNYKFLRKSALEFFQQFPESLNLKEVNQFYCMAVSQLFKEGIEAQRISEVLSLEKEDKEQLAKVKCGEPFYVLGNMFLDYKLYTRAVLEYIKAFEVGVPAEIKPSLLLNLSFVAVETEEPEVFFSVFGYLLSTYQEKSLATYPFYHYLRTLYEGKKSLSQAEKYLTQALSSNLSDFYKKRLISFMFNQALITKQYAKAWGYLQNSYFQPELKDYLLILLESLGKDNLTFERALEVAKQRFPKEPKIALIEVYYLESKGKIGKADTIWQGLTEASNLEKELAEIYKKNKELVERAQKLVF